MGEADKANPEMQNFIRSPGIVSENLKDSDVVTCICCPSSIYMEDKLRSMSVWHVKLANFQLLIEIIQGVFSFRKKMYTERTVLLKCLKMQLL